MILMFPPISHVRNIISYMTIVFLQLFEKIV
jgi:hypothetical protein